MVIAAGLGWVLQQPWWADMHWSLPDTAAGLLASLPPFLLFLILLRSSCRPLMDIRSFLESELAPIFAGWSLARLAILSLLAGVGEEVLFRGVLQGWLSRAWGTVPGVITASILFGSAHPMSRAYILLAGLIGAYLGVLWLATGNLLAPVVTHASYDFIALVYFLRVYWPAHRPR